jgi:iron complex outermembrane recepter protein
MFEIDKTNPIVRRAIRVALTGTSIAAVGIVQAQTPPPKTSSDTSSDVQLSEVVVTGSRIAVPNETSISPVTTVGAQDIERSGVTRVEDLLNQLPQVFASQTSTASNASDGTASINLRGLNPKRTLVLVDGQRLGPGDPISGGQSDINMIPTETIESVEVLTGGASSVYGADAVAGVVNFKLLDHFEGIKLIGDAGIYQHHNTDVAGVEDAIAAAGDTEPPSNVWQGAQREIGVIMGLNSPDDKGNATVYFTYRNVLPILESQYASSACTVGSGYIAGPYNTNGKFTCGGSATAYPMNLLSGNTFETVGANGSLSAGPALYNYGALNYFQRPDERYTAGAFLHYEFNDHVQVYSQSMFMDDFTQAQIAPSGLFGAPASEVNCTNPYLSSAESTFIGCNTSTTGFGNPEVYLLRRNVEGGGRVQSIEHMDFHTVLGVKGKIDNVWSYDVSYNFSLVNLNSDAENYFSNNNIANALDAVTNSSGQVVCGNANAAGCVPYNPFGTGTISAASLKYLYEPGIEVGRIYQHDAQANLNGDLGEYGVKLPTASSGLQLALGVEYRDARDSILPDEASQTGDLAGSGGDTTPVNGGLNVREGYFEAAMPLLDDQPFAKALNLDTGYRYSSYDLSFGSTNTFKFGLDWAPDENVRFRGSFSRAVRAPNIVELFGASSIGLDGTYGTDPCAGTTPVYTVAQCARTGVLSGQYGNISQSPAGQYNGLLGGNPNLKPETAITKSFGVGLTPSFLPNFRVQVDYYDIAIQNVIQSIGGSVILSQCALDGNLCDLIHRSASGLLWGGQGATEGYVSDTLINVGELEERGVDLDMSYSYSLGGWGKLVSNMVGTYINKYEISNPGESFNCAGLEGVVCGSSTSAAGTPVPHWRHRLATTWETPWRGTDVTVTWRYFGSTQLESIGGNPALAGGPGITVANGGLSSTDDHISSYSWFDLSVSTKLDDHVTLRLGCNNVLDKSPPVIGSSNIGAPPTGNGNTYPGSYDALGRYLFAQIVAQF